MKTDCHARWIILVGIIALVAAGTAAAGEEDGMLQVGQPFVEFELEAHDGSTVNSADLAGRPFLLFFYPKADTPG
jgi:cytochrome oxidase Cu insertion factor (SCO1/SenC/PrrC family)